MPKFINTELKSESESDSDLDSEKIETKFDNELMAKLEKSGFDFDSEYDILLIRFCLCLYF